jgi:hypothetical protein
MKSRRPTKRIRRVSYDDKSPSAATVQSHCSHPHANKENQVIPIPGAMDWDSITTGEAFMLWNGHLATSTSSSSLVGLFLPISKLERPPRHYGDSQPQICRESVILIRISRTIRLSSTRPFAVTGQELLGTVVPPALVCRLVTLMLQTTPALLRICTGTSIRSKYFSSTMPVFRRPHLLHLLQYRQALLRIQLPVFQFLLPRLQGRLHSYHQRAH